MQEYKKVSIKTLKKGDKFSHLYTPDSSRFASFEIIEITGAFVKLKVYDKNEEVISTEGCFVEVPLTDDEFKAKYKDKAAVVIEKLRNEISLTNENIGMHEMWNSWICTDPYEFAAECEKHNIELIGWFELGNDAKEFYDGIMLDIGIVAKYNDEDTRFWCHARKDWIIKMIEEWDGGHQ